jgi:ubiquinone/menaquinone biosynthesis C-methylase UbiE
MTKTANFYEKPEVIHEVVEAERSRICYDLILNLITERADKQRSGRILDIGCGDGSFSMRFRKYCKVFGIDISQNAIDLAKKAGVSAYKTDMSCQKLPFDNEYFDIVYMGDVIEHLLDPDFAVCEVARVLKSDGFLVLSTPNLASWLNRLLLVVGLQPLSSEVSTVKNFGRYGKQDITPVGHLRLFTYRALKEFLAYYQFSVLKVKGAPFGGLPSILGKVDMVISSIPSLSSILVLEAQKLTESSSTI